MIKGEILICQEEKAWEWVEGQDLTKRSGRDKLKFSELKVKETGKWERKEE